jgi:hypothetical protein
VSAGFKVADDVLWGTNGAVETYVASLSVQATARFGPDDPLAAFFRHERESFFMGTVVVLDEWLGDDTCRERFLEILDAATDQLLREGGFSEYGREWVVAVAAGLRAKIAGNDRAEP